MTDTVEVGQVWRGPEGGHLMQIVKVEGNMAHMLRADSPKKRLTSATSGYIVALSEFADWTRIS